MINDRTVFYDTVVCDKITADPAKSPNNSLAIVNAVLTNAKVNASSTATVSAIQATIYSNSNGTTGFQPSGTAAAKIVDLFTLPANTLTVGRSLYFTVVGTHAANTNSVTVAVNVGGTGGVGATVSGGTNVISYALIVNAGVFAITGQLVVQAQANETTISEANPGSTAVLANTNVASTFDITAANVINLTMNAASATTDATVVAWYIQAL
jgi:hypothetical protein